jgi:hypothetical protein
LAEEVLSGFYQVVDLIRLLRVPMRHQGESVNRVKPEDEDAATARRRDAYYVPLSRLDSYRQEISDLMARRYRMAAWFGIEADMPFRELAEVLYSIRSAAQWLMDHSDQNVDQTHPDLWKQLERDIWYTEKIDPISLKIDSATKQIEEICRPILGDDFA